ncbi:MAG: hypothetical protein AAGJ83_09560, partial [Planctomycetota bacterium]
MKWFFSHPAAIALIAWILAHAASPVFADDVSDVGQNVRHASSIADRLKLAGSNREQIEQALRKVPDSQREGMEFLVVHMPESDLTSLSSEYLLENTRLAYEAIEEAAWGSDIPKEIFLNDVLPYASINERRDQWRADFRRRCLPLIEGAESPGAAASLL